MPDIALYYPYSHVRDDAWLKAAALYLPKLALLAPQDYPFRFSPTALILRDELDFLVEVDPARRAHAVATEFLQLMNRDAAVLAARYAWREFPRNCAEFDAFCAHLDSLSPQFAELAEIEDSEVLRARLAIIVGRDLVQPTKDLDRGLRKLGLQPARAVLGMKSLELPAIAAAAASGAGLPVAAGQAGMAAAQFITSTIEARQTAETQRRSAAGYLLGLRGELSPTGVMERIRRMFRRASLLS